MTEQDFITAVSVLKEYTNFKENYDSKIIDSNNYTLQKYITIRNEIEKNVIANNNEVLVLYLKYFQDLKLHNQQTSFSFNALRFFNITEPVHSVLLANLLNPNAGHGQGDLFLKEFLFQIGINVGKTDKWIVTAEIGRVDILIKRKHPHAVVIIENKSNFANDQLNQIYRYWYKEIFLATVRLSIPIEKTKNNKNYQIIYLTPADWKKPTKNSLSKPDGYPDLLLSEVPIEPTIWLFEKQIVQWLKICIDLLPQENYRMREYVKQYIELWKP